MKIDLIVPSQVSLHNIEQLDRMIEFVKNGGFFTQETINQFAKENSYENTKLIQLVKLDDGMILGHDGHHRMLSALLGGRSWLRDDEFYLVERTYKMYDDINFAASWMTPHDPLTEVRHGDIFGFKNKVQTILKTSSEKQAIEYIRANKHLYSMPRGRIKNILDLKPEN